MKKYILILFVFVSSFANAQDSSLCEQCVEQNGFYCGDDPANWTQYSPNGCVPNGYQDLFYLNDGWEDCVDGSDEAEAVPTTAADCGTYGEEPCDTVFVNTIEYETIFDTIYNTTIEYDTIVQIEYIQQTDTIIEIQYEQIVEYIDCDSGLPCNTSIMEIVDKSKSNSVIYNIQGQAIKVKEGLYIENGKIYYKK